MYRMYKVLIRVMFFLSCLLLTTSYLSAKGFLEEDNNGKIRGTVLSSDGTPVEGIPVLLKNTKKTAFTNQSGVFEFNNVKPGLQVVAISLPGYEVTTEEVTVEENKTAGVTIHLRATEKQLQEVVISGNGNKFARRQTDYVARLPLCLMW